MEEGEESHVAAVDRGMLKLYKTEHAKSKGGAGGIVCCRLSLCQRRNFVSASNPMGFEPLPFDPRNACFCRQNCPSFEQPTSRWWTVWSNPPPSIPELGTGVLVEFTQVITIPPFCRFRPDVLPVGVFVYFLDIGPIAPIPGPTVKRNVAVFTNVGSSFAELVVDNEECNIPLNLPPQTGSGAFGGCNIFPVRWFENANDVPH